jgi:hypothetical protein
MIRKLLDMLRSSPRSKSPELSQRRAAAQEMLTSAESVKRELQDGSRLGSWKLPRSSFAEMMRRYG